MIFIYELMNELVDCGYPQLSTINQLSEMIQIPKDEDDGMLNIKIGSSHKTNSSASKRTITQGKSEFYIDVIERVCTTVKNGEILNAEI